MVQVFSRLTKILLPREKEKNSSIIFLFKNSKQTYSASLISNRGSWIKFEIDSKSQVWIRIDKVHKINAYVFLRAIGLSVQDIQKGISKYAFLLNASELYAKKELKKEIGKTSLEDMSNEEALLIVHGKLRPNEPASEYFI